MKTYFTTPFGIRVDHVDGDLRYSEYTDQMVAIAPFALASVKSGRRRRQVGTMVLLVVLTATMLVLDVNAGLAAVIAIVGSRAS